MRPARQSLFVLLAPVFLLLQQTGVAAEEPSVGASAVLQDRFPERRISFAGGVTAIADITYYSPAGYRPLTLDLYVPGATRTDSDSALPLVVYVHGGGWSSGHSRQAGAFENFPKVLASLAARGYVVASLNYRLDAEAKFPAPIQDVKAALRWLHANARTYRIDPARSAVWGGSAGGHLAALAATSCNAIALEPPPDTVPGSASPAAPVTKSGDDCVQSAVIWYGIFDLAPIALQPPIRQLLGCATEACSTELVREASPLTYITSSTPPMLLIAGSDDKVVNPDQSRHFDRALQSVGVPVKIMLLQGVGHSFVGSTLETTRAASLTALKATFDFFDSTLRAGKK
jgi:acetyl esterase/lipase